MKEYIKKFQDKTNDIYDITLGPLIELAMIAGIIWLAENKLYLNKKEN